MKPMPGAAVTRALQQLREHYAAADQSGGGEVNPMTLDRAKVIARRWWIATLTVLVASTLAAGVAWLGFDFALRHPLALLAFPICMARSAHWSGWIRGHEAADAQPANLEAQK